jgi:hypothetical protein
VLQVKRDTFQLPGADPASTPLRGPKINAQKVLVTVN